MIDYDSFGVCADWLYFWVFSDFLYYGRLHGIDIRKHGSGNAGTTNSLRVLGKKEGAIVLFCDILKETAVIFYGKTKKIYYDTGVKT